MHYNRVLQQQKCLFVTMNNDTFGCLKRVTFILNANIKNEQNT